MEQKVWWNGATREGKEEWAMGQKEIEWNWKAYIRTYVCICTFAYVHTAAFPLLLYEMEGGSDVLGILMHFNSHIQYLCYDRFLGRGGRLWLGW